jgi:hypothetical protein
MAGHGGEEDAADHQWLKHGASFDWVHEHRLSVGVALSS